jgi:hypothetical protein
MMLSEKFKMAVMASLMVLLLSVVMYAIYACISSTCIFVVPAAFAVLKKILKALGKEGNTNDFARICFTCSWRSLVFFIYGSSFIWGILDCPFERVKGIPKCLTLMMKFKSAVAALESIVDVILYVMDKSTD